ncbi:MAG: DUF1453 family protein [Burkholderiales bacterium]|nr:DUF1453 family protein [Burkholderiales bacterium]
MTLSPQTWVVLAFVPLICWRLYARIRKMVGRQKSSPKRQWLAAILWPVLLILLAGAAQAHPDALLALLGGAGVGIVLGIVGHRLTQFDQTDDGLFYTPNAHLGIALSMLLVARVLYRVVTTGLPQQAGPVAMAPSAITLAIFGTLAGYYATYALGLIAWRRRAARAALGTELGQ